MIRGSSSERSSVRDIVLPAPRESVSFFSGSALARLSERVTSACVRSASAAATSASACAPAPDDRAEAPAAAAPRSARGRWSSASAPPSALSESAPLPTAKPVATTAIDESVSEVLSAALGARRALEARCFGACGCDDDTSMGPNLPR